MIAADWSLSRIALQLLTEEKVGRPMREARAEEDAAAKRTEQALGAR